MDGKAEAERALRQALEGAERLVEDLRRALEGLQGERAPEGPSQEDMGVVGHLRDIVGRPKGIVGDPRQ